MIYARAQAGCFILAFILACQGSALAQSSTDKVVAAANKFLATLTAEQKQRGALT